MSSPTEGLMEAMSAKIKALTEELSAENVDALIAGLAVAAALLTLVVAFWIMAKLYGCVFASGGKGGTAKKKVAFAEMPVVAEVAGNAWMNAAGITHPAEV